MKNKKILQILAMVNILLVVYPSWGGDRESMVWEDLIKCPSLIFLKENVAFVSFSNLIDFREATQSSIDKYVEFSNQLVDELNDWNIDTSKGRRELIEQYEKRWPRKAEHGSMQNWEGKGWGKSFPQWLLEFPISSLSVMSLDNKTKEVTKYFYGLTAGLETFFPLVSRQPTEEDLNVVSNLYLFSPQVIACPVSADQAVDYEDYLWVIVAGDTTVSYYRDLTPEGYKAPFRVGGNPFWLSCPDEEPLRSSCGLAANGLIYITDPTGRLGFFDVKEKAYSPDFYDIGRPVLAPADNRNNSVFIKKTTEWVECIPQFDQPWEVWLEGRHLPGSVTHILYASDDLLLTFSDESSKLGWYDRIQERSGDAIQITDYLSLYQAAYSVADQKVYFLLADKRTVEGVYYNGMDVGNCQVDVYQLLPDAPPDEKFMKFDETIMIRDARKFAPPNAQN